MRTLRVLHLEDDFGDAERVRSSLEHENVDCTIDRVSSREHFQKALQSDPYDLILSDFTSTDFGGMEALAIAKDVNPEIPFLLLSENVNNAGERPSVSASPVESHLKRRLQRLSSTVLRAHLEANERRERQANEDQIRQQADLLNHARDAIFVRNLDQDIIYWNKSAERIYGWTAAEVIGKRASDILYKKDAPPRHNIWKTVLEKGEWSGEIVQTTKAGADITVSSRRTLLRDSNEIANAVLNINTDITEKKDLESQILRGQRIDSIGSLAGGIAHDLNNVLAPILVVLDLLRDSAKNLEDLNLLDVAQASAQRGASLVKQILQFTQGTKSQGTIKIKSLIDDLANLIRQTFPPLIILKTDIPADLPHVLCDPTQLHQILLNLCVNARDAMPKGGSLTIVARHQILDGRIIPGYPNPISGTFVELAVTDTGSGIPPEILHRIFEPFFTTKPPGKGTGLGLASVATIIRNIQGYLEVSTSLGHGTTFRVLLPSSTQDIFAEPEIRASSPLTGHGQLILLVDDELVVLEMTRQLLETHGYQVMTAINGAEALLCFKAHEKTVAAVITDMLMPGLAGDELIASIRQISPRAISICLSGSPDETGLRASQTNADAFLKKPCSTKDLLTILQTLLSNRESK